MFFSYLLNYFDAHAIDFEREELWLWDSGIKITQGKQCILLSQGPIRGTIYFYSKYFLTLEMLHETCLVDLLFLCLHEVSFLPLRYVRNGL